MTCHQKGFSAFKILSCLNSCPEHHIIRVYHIMASWTSNGQAMDKQPTITSCPHIVQIPNHHIRDLLKTEVQELEAQSKKRSREGSFIKWHHNIFSERETQNRITDNRRKYIIMKRKQNDKKTCNLAHDSIYNLIRRVCVVYRSSIVNMHGFSCPRHVKTHRTFTRRECAHLPVIIPAPLYSIPARYIPGWSRTWYWYLLLERDLG